MGASRWILVWISAGALVACSSGDNSGFTLDGGDAPYEAPPGYDGGHTGDAAHDGSADGGGGGDGAVNDGGGDSPVDAPSESGDDAGADADAGGDAGDDADATADGAGDGGDDGAMDASVDADATIDAPPDADGGTIVPPTCDGVISQGEYGGAGNHDMSGMQNWYMTWDDNNLYVAIDTATVTEGNVLYLAAGAGPSTTSGFDNYDNTVISSLPFGATLAVYAKDSYDEVRVPVSTDAGVVWGGPTPMVVKVCVNAQTNVREEIISWTFVGGRPASFDWLGYLAANPQQNPTGYIYGQEPADNPGGSPANNETYMKYWAVPDATPGLDAALVDEQ